MEQENKVLFLGHEVCQQQEMPLPELNEVVAIHLPPMQVKAITITSENIFEIMDNMIAAQDRINIARSQEPFKLTMSAKCRETLQNTLVYFNDLEALKECKYWIYNPKKVDFVILSLFQKHGLYKVRAHFGGKFKYWFYHGTNLLFKADTLSAYKQLQQ